MKIIVCWVYRGPLEGIIPTQTGIIKQGTMISSIVLVASALLTVVSFVIFPREIYILSGLDMHGMQCFAGEVGGEFNGIMLELP